MGFPSVCLDEDNIERSLRGRAGWVSMRATWDWGDVGLIRVALQGDTHVSMSSKPWSI